MVVKFALVHPNSVMLADTRRYMDIVRPHLENILSATEAISSMPDPADGNTFQKLRVQQSKDAIETGVKQMRVLDEVLTNLQKLCEGQKTPVMKVAEVEFALQPLSLRSALTPLHLAAEDTGRTQLNTDQQNSLIASYGALNHAVEGMDMFLTAHTNPMYRNKRANIIEALTTGDPDVLENGYRQELLHGKERAADLRREALATGAVGIGATR